MRQCTPWTKREIAVLYNGAGIRSFEWMREKLDELGVAERSLGAIQRKMQRLCGSSSLAPRTLSLTKFSQKTNYNKAQILRAKSALGLNWSKTSNGTRSRYIISEDHQEMVLAWLKENWWAPRSKADKCLYCHSRKRPHRSYGLCGPCFNWYATKVASAGFPIAPDRLMESLGDVPADVANRLRDRLALPAEFVRSLEDGNG